MKKIIGILLLTFCMFSYAEPDFLVPITKVIDGDTIEVSLQLPPPLNKASVRILGIDTPESNHLAKCPKEKNLGIQAKLFTHLIVGSNTAIILKNYKWDKYGGRIDADAYIGEINIAKSLIDQGLAKPYTGQGDKPDWCK